MVFFELAPIWIWLRGGPPPLAYPHQPTHPPYPKNVDKFPFFLTLPLTYWRNGLISLRGYGPFLWWHLFSKNLIEPKFKSNCDKTQTLKLWPKWKSQIVTTQKLKLWLNSKTKIVTKLKNLNCDKTQKLKLWQNSKKLNIDKTQKN